MTFNPDNPREHLEVIKGGQKMGDFTPEQPRYKGDGVAVWVGQDKNGRTMLSIKILNNPVIHAFKNEPKPQQQSEL